MGEFEKEVMDYIKQEMRKGFSQEEIRGELIRVGHDIEKIEKHFDHVHKHRKRKKHALLWALIIVIAVYVLLLILGDPSIEPEQADDVPLANSKLDDENYYMQAIREADRSICEKISHQDLKSSCIMAVKTPEEIREAHTQNTDPNIGLFKEALLSKDPQKCEMLQDEYLRADCLSLVAPSATMSSGEEGNVEGAASPEPAKLTDQQYMSLAISSKDVNYCYEILNKDVRRACESTVSSLGGN